MIQQSRAGLAQPGTHGWRRSRKRAFDAVVATILLLVFSPVLLIAAVLVKLDSPGPVLYRQRRIKFRSMRSDTGVDVHRDHVSRLICENLGVEQLRGCETKSLKLEKDPRITRVGRIIRKTSLDELPQLINVLRGEMSLVGPRPPLPYEVALYQDWHRRRLEVLPGITGWWQVKGRNRVSFDEMVSMDLYYIEHASFWLDLHVLLLTPWAALSGRGAG
jgi:lipopolysaccharide/colanic/teichoic acid biosynthesis glycosyltransferase